MKPLLRCLSVAVVFAAALAFCGSAIAANVVVGPELTGKWETFECGVPTCTYINDELAGAGATVTSPVTGAIVSFSVVNGETAGTYRLRTANRPGGGSGPFIFKNVSPVITAVPSAGVQTYPVSLPITAGHMVGLTTSETASVGFQAGGRSSEYESEPPENVPSLAGFSNPETAGFNVTIQPAPTITSVGVASGPTAGGTAVPIAGTDFSNVTGVTFGTVPAASFSVSSEGALTAVAPATAAAGAVSVTVTTIAGKGSAAGAFTYVAPPVAPPPVQHCVVPNLRGKNLKAARAALEKAECKLGKVTKLAGATPKSGKVSKQGAKAGAKVVVGTKVTVTLKPPAAPKKHAKGKH